MPRQKSDETRVQTSIYLSKYEIAALRWVAQRAGLSVSAVVRDWVYRDIKNQPQFKQYWSSINDN